MRGPTTEPSVLSSCARADAKYASRLRELLCQAGITVLPSDEEGPARAPIRTATANLVLIGPETRFEKWVDMEMEFATKPSKSGPGAGLIGIVLPTNDDYKKPCYEPELVPFRLHDRILGEYATLKKSSDDPREIAQWIADAEQRTYQYDVAPSLRILQSKPPLSRTRPPPINSTTKHIRSRPRAGWCAVESRFREEIAGVNERLPRGRSMVPRPRQQPAGRQQRRLFKTAPTQNS